MMKKLLSLMASVVLALSLAVPAFAAEATSAQGKGSEFGYVLDDADILTQNEWLALTDQAENLAGKYACDAHIVIVDDYAMLGDDVVDACDAVYTDLGLGVGPDHDTIILLMSMDDRDYALMAYGDYGHYAFTPYAIKTIEDAMLDDFGDDEWATGFAAYLSQCDTILQAAESGNPLEEPIAMRVLKSYGIALVVGLVIALIVCFIFKSQMKTAVEATSADHYMVPEGMDIRVREDTFSHTTRTEIEIKSESSSAGGSGSSGKF